MAKQTPSIGRIVHVVGTPEIELEHRLYRGTHVAALITQVGTDVLLVTAFVPGTPGVPTSVGIENYGDGPGQWHWPEFVPPGA